MHWIPRALLVLAALVTTTVAALFAEWIPVLGKNERYALKFITRTGTPPGGENAFAALWFPAFEVPIDQLESVVQADLRVVATHGWLGFSSAAAQYPLRPDPKSAEGVCTGEWTEDCLSLVRRQPLVTRQSLEQLVTWLDLSDYLRTFGHLRNPLPVNLDSPIPDLGGIANVTVTRAALTFIDADAQSGLEDACRTVLTWRRLRTGTDMLIASMLAIEYSSVALRLVSEMLAELPQDAPLPLSCTDALAPLSANEVETCELHRGEFRSLANSLSETYFFEQRVKDARGMTFGRHVMSAVYNSRHTAGHIATQFASACGLEVSRSTRCSGAAQLLNPFGCGFVANFRLEAEYIPVRIADFDRRLALARAARWWRTQPSASTGDRAAWPDEFAAIRDQIILDPATRTLALPMRDTRNPKRRVFRVRY